MYVSSENIIAFPTSRRIGRAQESRLLSEKALTRIVNTLIDADSFIITDLGEIAADSELEFNIHGYYFKVDDLTEIYDSFSEDLDVYAFIRLDITSGELIGFDDDNNGQENAVYNGIMFANNTTQPTLDGTEYFSLHVLHREDVNDSWSVSPDGKEKFSSDSFQVDGGVIV